MFRDKSKIVQLAAIVRTVVLNFLRRPVVGISVFAFPPLLLFLFLGRVSTRDQVVDRELLPTAQLIRPAGKSVEFGGRPVDLILSPDGKRLYVKDDRGIVMIDPESMKVIQELPFGKGLGGSVHGIVVTRDGSRVYATTAQNLLFEAELSGRELYWKRRILLPGPGKEKDSHACGIALSPDERRAFVCLSRSNSLGVVDIASGALLSQIAVGVAPFDVIIAAGGATAYVSNWGGRHPEKGQRSAPSSGTAVAVDERGVAGSGTVSFVDLKKGREVARIETGLHPSDLELSRDGLFLFVANANSDSVSVINTRQKRVVEIISTRPDPALPFGSATNGVTLSRSGTTLYAANGGNNAVAVVSLGSGTAKPSRIEGFIPVGWYPGAVISDAENLYIANVKGSGSRNADKSKRHASGIELKGRPGSFFNQENVEQQGWHVKWYLGTVSKVPMPSRASLAAYTEQVRADGRIPQILTAREKAAPDRKPVPVPERPGEPTVFEHVVYIIKENRTYDQILGDLKQGNGDPALCLFDRKVTPNHHALAEQFVLLDNFYCNGVVSTDGHAWATEGNATDYLEKSFGGFTRSYPWGDDPLAYSSSGFIWDSVLLRGLSFRNYGEMDYAETLPDKATFKDVYRDYLEKTGRIRFSQNIGIETLRRYSCPGYPGWNLKIPDMLRADRFLDEFKQFDKKGDWPAFVMIFLGNDHTSGAREDYPTPRAQVADNDTALGRIIEGITHSTFWPGTCIFVIEDDPQDGFDHVDGHRSVCLVISPYTRRGAVVSKFYNQTSVLHTMERILGLNPMNQMDALAPVMTECFQDSRDTRPYKALPNEIPLDEMNPPVKKLAGMERYWAEESARQPVLKLDQADEDVFSRIIWHSVKGASAPYPAHLAGSHGKGLKQLKLRLLSRRAFEK